MSAGEIAECVICGVKFKLAGNPVLTCGKHDCMLEAQREGLFKKVEENRWLKRK
jgi:hypothetical protein